MQWLILCISLTGLRDAQITGEALFLGVSMRVFSGGSFPVSKMRKEITLINVGGHHPIHESQTEQKVEAGQIFSLSPLELGFLPFPQTSEFLVLRPLDSWTYTSSFPSCQAFELKLALGSKPLAFLVLQFTNGRLWDF